MNATSSRSHTVLTLTVEQRSAESARTLRSKLLMVDLAGSERVRRTVSRGTRLNEAKAINTSLSALGNVISALAETSPAHVPFRDSKLTRLLQDSLGGTATTALIATVGPAAINYSETLSTLLFASRCMSVRLSPVQHEQVDLAELCARLQERVARMEGEWVGRLAAQQDHYERVIEGLRGPGLGLGWGLGQGPHPRRPSWGLGRGPGSRRGWAGSWRRRQRRRGRQQGRARARRLGQCEQRSVAF